MAKNWYFDLQEIAKTNAVAKEHVMALKEAKTDEQKQTAKANAQAFVEAQTQPQMKFTGDVTQKDIPEMKIVEQPKEQPKIIDPITINEPIKIQPKIKTEEVQPKTIDLSAPAEKKSWAKMGITREEELFKMGIRIQKMTLQERIAMRARIDEKIRNYQNSTQEQFRKKQLEQIQKDANDPEKIKWNRQRQFVLRITEELQQNHNILYILKNVENMTVEIMKELLDNPANVATFSQYDKNFANSFKKLFG